LITTEVDEPFDELRSGAGLVVLVLLVDDVGSASAGVTAAVKLV